MSRDKNLISEIDITNNRYTVPTLGDFLSNDTNDFAHFLQSHSSGISPCKALARPSFEVELMVYL